MGAVMLRAERCLNCGGPMPVGLRIDARYCKPSCRTLAYRIRRRTYGPANQSARHAPRWAAGQTPIIRSALASLASLQAQILQLALQLEQQDIAFRHHPRADAADPAGAAVGTEHGQPAATGSEDATERVEMSLGAGAAVEEYPAAEIAESVRRTPAMDLKHADPLGTPRRTQAHDPDFQVLSQNDELLPAEAPAREPQRPNHVEQLLASDPQSNNGQQLNHVDRLLLTQARASQSKTPDHVKNLLDSESSAKKPRREIRNWFSADTRPEAPRKAAPPAVKQQRYLPTRAPQPRASALQADETGVPASAQRQQVRPRPASTSTSLDQTTREPAPPFNVRPLVAPSTRPPADQPASSQAKPGLANHVGHQLLRGGDDPLKSQSDPARRREAPLDHVGELLRKGSLKDHVGRILRESGAVKDPKRDAPDYVGRLLGKDSDDEP